MSTCQYTARQVKYINLYINVKTILVFVVQNFTTFVITQTKIGLNES